MKVILGTAHGSNISGKRSPDGRLQEWKWSREVCQLIRCILKQNNIDCTIDIETDKEESLSKRVAIVNKICNENNNDCIYVSVHVDASGDGSKWDNKASGWTVRVGTKASEKSKELALCLFEEAEKYNIFGNRWIPDTKWFEQNLYVCNKTNCPAVLTENMFQTNKDDVEWLLSDKGKNTIAQIHADGIINYINKKQNSI